ncbi:hypothetical protein V3H18_03085 [Methylocystis sp. 9N]|uniref:Uncharacterized protein n=1 Tax=Methylocystis borbori TaxID=3118750 RepID=A0ABU7XEB6_9HYPH
MRIFLAVVLAAFAAQSASAESWRAYHNPRFGTTAEVPQGWRMGAPPENNDGRVFTSPDGRAEIIVSGMFSIGPRKEEFALRLGPLEGETIEYERRGRDWLVVSGVKGEKIFYRKSLLSCRDTIWNSVFLEYPASEKDKYDPLVGHVAASLRAKCK